MSAKAAHKADCTCEPCRKARNPLGYYSLEERREMLRKVNAITERFYWAAVQTNCHPFIEFCGLMTTWMRCAAEAERLGVPFMHANVHSGIPMPMHEPDVMYLAEKFSCIFGPTFAHYPELWALFKREMEATFREVEPGSASGG